MIVAIACVHEIPVTTQTPSTGGTGTGTGSGTGTSSCDTTQFNYSTVINPMIQTFCVACHGATTASSSGGGIDLSNYSKLLPFVTNGRFFGSINHSTGYSPMPKGGAQFSACQITQISKWIAAGAKNDTATTTNTPTTPTTPLPTSNCSPDTVYFQNTISPLIGSTCAMAGCHDATTKASGVNLSTYANIVRYVVAGNAAGSELYTITKSGKMPPSPNPKYTTTQLAQLQTWINQGAKNNFCTSCDTTTYTYAKAVAPILTTSCVGCHGATTAAASGGGIDLSSYAQVKIYATNGRLYGSINHTAGYSAMPKNLAQLPVCQIIQVKKWIDAGSLNN